MAKDITFRHDRSNYLARVDNDQEFFVGKRVHYLENVGLENEVIVTGHVYCGSRTGW